MRVYILKTYRDGEDPFGVECVFETLRVGFPTAAIIIYDNIDRIEHHEWLERIVRDCEVNHPDEPIVFLDTDVIFYNNIEVYLQDIPQLLAGRLCPAYWNEVVEANECQRFHTSLLFIKSAKTLMNKVSGVYQQPNFKYNAFAPVRYTLSNRQYFHDTCGNLFHLLSSTDRYNFTPQMLDLYTHLVSGSMLNYVAGRMANKTGLKATHQKAKDDPMSVFGIWREHNRYYANNPPKLA